MTIQQSIEVLHGFIDESNESLQNIESIFIQLEKDPGNPEIIDHIFRPIHSLKGNSGFFGLTNINKFSHRLENLLELIRKDELAVTAKVIDILLNGVDFLRKMLDRAFDDPADTELRPEEEEFLIQQVDACTPAVTTGSIQSFYNLQVLLEEAIDLEIDLRNTSLIHHILEQIEKSYEGIKEIVNRKKSIKEKSLYVVDGDYYYNGIDCSHFLRPLGDVLDKLEKKLLLTDEQQSEFLKALDNIEDVMEDRKDVQDVFDKLRALANFFDDDLLVSSDEFYGNLIPLTNDLISRFENTTAPTAVKRVGEILADQGKIDEQQLSKALDKQKRIGEILVDDGLVDSKDLQKALNIQTRQVVKAGKPGKPGREKTIRIDQYKLDEFANSVGELFINLDAFSFLKSRMEEAKTDFEILSKFANIVSSMDDRVTKLQENIMDIRKVPVKNLFQRFPRIVRQLSMSLEKEIDFRILGEDTVIDKDLLEKMENPLVHILRNAIDHGIESAEQRTEKGKDPKGVITLDAMVDEYFFHLSIKDDGGGIDPEKMKNTARKKSILTDIEIANMSDKELVNLVFRPGFSTAETVSDLSGRGVGMDVVMSSLKDCNGTVEVNSELDKGTTVNIKIPLTKTLVTKDALIVESSGQLFAIPSDDITTTLYVSEVDLGSILAEDKVISYNGAIHKVESINKYYYHETAMDFKNLDQVLVVCSKHHMALLVDRMLNHQKIVVKSFPKGLKQFNTIPGIDGYTLLGNEDIVMIVDVDEIVKSLTSDSEHNKPVMSQIRDSMNVSVSETTVIS